MKDRIPTYAGRVKLIPVSNQPNTYDMERADEPIQEGTPINKETLLNDDTASSLGLDEQATVNEAISRINQLKLAHYRWTQTATAGVDTPLCKIDVGATLGGFLLSIAYTVSNLSVSDIYLVSMVYGSINITKISDGGFNGSNARTIKAWTRVAAYGENGGGAIFTINPTLTPGNATATARCVLLPLYDTVYFNKYESGEISVPDGYTVLASLNTVNRQNLVSANSTNSPSVIETGTSGIWTYRKWSDGTYECWGTSAKSCALTNEWGGMYHAGEEGMFQEAYPVTFLEDPTIQYTMHSSASVVALSWGWGNKLTHTPKVTPMRPKDQGTFTVYVYWYVKGKVAT